jgi:hypothetical protein
MGGLKVRNGYQPPPVVTFYNNAVHQAILLGIQPKTDGGHLDLLERKVINAISHFALFQADCDQLQLVDRLANRDAQLVSEYDAGEFAAGGGPAMRNFEKIGVLGEYQAARVRCPLQDWFVVSITGVVFKSSHHRDATLPDSVGNC